ncbi:MAG: hypothetical protein ACOCRX_06560 [Candidatus Woesearchaeota archaeon]
MTVGITLNNDDYAVIIVDSRVSSMSRESDSIDKIAEFNQENYHGVIFGSGRGNLVLDLNRDLKNFNEDSVDSLVDKVYSEMLGKIDKKDKNYLMNLSREYEKINSSLFLSDRKLIDKLKGMRFIEKSDKEKINYLTEKMIVKYENINDEDLSEIKSRYFDRKRSSKTEFLTVLYDKDHEKIRKYHFNYINKDEIFLNYDIIGSGKDYAHSYLLENLVGKKVDDFKIEDFVLFGINSYSKSTLNEGVGGRPKIFVLDKNTNKKLDRDLSIYLSNLSGIFLSNTTKISELDLKENINKIINSNFNYNSFLKEYNLEDSINKFHIPYSSFLEGSSNKNYNSL